MMQPRLIRHCLPEEKQVISFIECLDYVHDTVFQNEHTSYTGIVSILSDKLLVKQIHFQNMLCW
jgi:hypothetical protein